ncbi:MAG: hypothetical protein ACFB51_11925 [Anaerolineae bacterium]
MSVERVTVQEGSDYIGQSHPGKSRPIEAGDEIVIVRDRLGRYIYDLDRWERVYEYRCPRTGIREEAEVRKMPFFKRLLITTGGSYGVVGGFAALVLASVITLTTIFVVVINPPEPEILPAPTLQEEFFELSDLTLSTATPTITPTPGPLPIESVYEEVQVAALAYHDGATRLVTEYDVSALDEAAADDAYNDRIAAFDILVSAGDCYWQYDDGNFYFLNVRLLSQSVAEAVVQIERDGTVFCPFGSDDPNELSQFRFEGPIYAIYMLERINEQWIVTEVNNLGTTPPDRSICDCVIPTAVDATPTPRP